MSSEILKENNHYLKACILYEVLQKKPISDSYRNFCATVGQDAISYPDFEFWFYRFYDGNRDFDYDRSADPEPKTLMDMPVELMYKIVGNLDSVERNVLGSVNRPMQGFADELSGLEIEQQSEDMRWMKFINIPGLQVKHLCLITIGSQVNFPDRLPVSIKTKSVDITAGTINQMIELLSIAKPGKLKSIRLSNRRAESFEMDSFPRIFDTEQFKQAKHVDIVGYVTDYNLSLFNFRHLNSFKLRIRAPAPGELFRVLRDDIPLYYKPFETCEIIIVDSEDRFKVRSIGEALGEEVPFGPSKTITHRHRIPKSKDYLEFEIKDEGRSCRIKIVKVC